MVETVTIDGQVIPLEELEAILGPLQEPLDLVALQALIDEANREASDELAALLAALVVVAISSLSTVPRQRIIYSNRDRAYYQGRSPLTNDATVRRLNAEQQRNAMRFRRRTEAMISGNLSFEDWQRQTARDIVLSHTRAFQAGAGTAANLTARHIASLRDLTRDELRFFNAFAQQIARGELSEAMMLYRSSQYGFGTAKSYNLADQINHDDGRWLGRRFLDPAADHCPDCPSYQQVEWVPASEIVPVGMRCRCGGRCRCRQEFRLATLSDRLPAAQRL